MTDDFLAADRDEFRQAMTTDPTEKWKATAREVLKPYVGASDALFAVAAALAEAYGIGAVEEREACALTAENFNVEDGDGQEPDYYHGILAASNSIAAAIRSRGASCD